MQTKRIINSDLYWDSRFENDWDSLQGPAQSRFFARLAIENLPRWLIEQLRLQPLTICDWGCAQGDGTDVWASYVDPQRITGIDFSPVAIDQAARRYPAIRFLRQDWLTTELGELSLFDIVFSSNTLEHFHEPHGVLKYLSARATKSLVLLLPYREFDRHQEHFYTFLPGNIPSVIDSRFRLVWSRVVDCRQLPNSYWGGDQIILVYANSGWIDGLGLTLQDFGIEQIDSAKEIINLTQALSERDGQIASPIQAAAWRDGHIASLIQAGAERDGQIVSLIQAAAERDGQIVTLNQAAAERDGHIVTLDQAAAERDGQIVTLNQAAAERDGQIVSLIQAVAERDGHIASLNQAAVERDEQIANSNYSSMLAKTRIQELSTSTSWRILFPARIIEQLVLASTCKNSRYALLKSIYWKFPERLRTLLNKRRYKFVAKHFRGRAKDFVASIPDSEVDLDPKIEWVAQAQAASKLVVIPCAFEFDNLVNQRPINAAKHYSTRGFLVLYVAWQWSPEDTLSKGIIEAFNNVIQVPLYEFLKHFNMLLLDDKVAHYFLTMPARRFTETLDVWRSKGGIVIYDVMDEWEEFFKAGQAPWYEKILEQEVVLKADFVSVVSPRLRRKFECIRTDISVIGNGYTSSLLGVENKGVAGKRQGDRVIIGYFGHLTDAWFDWELLFSEASKSNNYYFEIIGYGEPEWVQKTIPQFGNISLLGKILPANLHSYVSRWSIGLIPFIKCGLSDAVDPIKIYEYLYFGLPVVVTGIGHVKDYPKTYFATRSTIQEAITLALADATTIDVLEEFLRTSTWEARFDSLMNLILARKSLFSLYEH